MGRVGESGGGEMETSVLEQLSVLEQILYCIQ